MYQNIEIATFLRQTAPCHIKKVVFPEAYLPMQLSSKVDSSSCLVTGDHSPAIEYCLSVAILSKEGHMFKVLS